MAPVRIETNWKLLPEGIRNKLDAALLKHQITEKHLLEVQAWLSTKPLAPDEKEAPKGWYKRLRTCTVPGDGHLIKTILPSPTLAVEGVNLDEWEPSPALPPRTANFNIDDWLGE
jgi:hypothetical protein